MQNARRHFRLGKIPTSAICFVLSLLVFSSLLIGASASLHERFHNEASQSSHQCAVTLFEQLQLLHSEPLVVVVETSIGLPIANEIFRGVCFSSFDYRTSPSRAPPVSFFSNNG